MILSFRRDERYLSPAARRGDSSQTQVDVASAVTVVRGQRARKDGRIRCSQGGLGCKNTSGHVRLVRVRGYACRSYSFAYFNRL